MPTEVATRKSLEPWILDSVQYYAHQIEGIRKLARMNSFILADDMGLGKSLQALTVFGIDVAQKWSKTALVVCPVSLKANWQDEIEKFTRFPCVLLDGTPVVRTKQLAQFTEIEGPKILIVNYEQVVAHKAVLDSFRFDVAIFDECHYLKNPKTKRTKACLTLYSRRSFLLSGTPMLNHVNELWAPLHRVDPGAYPKYWSFVNRYVVFGGYKDKAIVGTKNSSELTERLKNVMLRRLKKDVLDLPEVQIIQRRVKLAPEQKRLYDEVKNEMRLETEDGPQDIQNALTMFLRLKQICGTTLDFTGEDISSKLDLAVEDDLELIQNKHRIVVFTQFRSVLQAHSNRLKAHGVPVWELHGDVKISDRQPIVKEWGMSESPGVIVCMLQVAGVGLNMVQARHGSFLDKLFVPGLNQQAIDRLHRIGQNVTQPVQIREYIAKGTIENRVEEILRIKRKLSDEIVDTDPKFVAKLLAYLEEGE